MQSPDSSMRRAHWAFCLAWALDRSWWHYASWLSLENRAVQSVSMISLRLNLLGILAIAGKVNWNRCVAASAWSKSRDLENFQVLSHSCSSQGDVSEISEISKAGSPKFCMTTVGFPVAEAFVDWALKAADRDSGNAAGIIMADSRKANLNSNGLLQAGHNQRFFHCARYGSFGACTGTFLWWVRGK